jgi:hypothetical protein
VQLESLKKPATAFAPSTTTRSKIRHLHEKLDHLLKQQWVRLLEADGRTCGAQAMNPWWARFAVQQAALTFWLESSGP